MQQSPANRHINKYLMIKGTDLLHAASEFGTPLYLYDPVCLKINYCGLKKHLPDPVNIYYSAKANPNKYITQFFYNLGANVEIASMGELMMVKETGIPGKNIILVGPGKSSELLEEAIDSSIFQIVAESRGEIERISRIAEQKKKLVNVSLRVNPVFKSGTKVSMSGKTQFGMDEEEAISIFHESATYPCINMSGIHGYVGTKQLDPQSFLNNTHEILMLSQRIQEAAQKSFTFLDIGGGLGIPYYEKEEPFSFSDIEEELDKQISDYLNMYPNTYIALESGRFLVGNAGIFLAKVLDKKQVKGMNYLILDGGTNNIQYDNQFGSRIPPLKVVDGENREDEIVTLCGPLCTPTDILAKNVTMPKCEENDLIAFYQAGAYGTTIAPGLFLSHGYPTEVMFNNGSFTMIRKPFSWKDILKLQEV